MKLYTNLSDLIRAVFARETGQVIAVLNINSKAYYVFKSQKSKEQFINRTMASKFIIGNQLDKNRFLSYECDKDLLKNDKSTKAAQRLVNYLKENDFCRSLSESESLHAEEVMILKFKEALSLFVKYFPNEKVKSIEVYLSHSPCAEASLNQKKCSSAKKYQNLNHEGCEEKLNQFFKKSYKIIDPKLFMDSTKVSIRYHTLFDPSHTYKENHLIKESDSQLKSVLQPIFK